MGTEVPHRRLSPLVPLFFPRWAWGGVIPVAVLTLALGIVALPREGESGSGKRITRVDAVKRSGEVVFLIANGGREHRVSKASAPGTTGGGAASRTSDGTFRDTLESTETIVFYRFD
jgi:hypothetical protein